MQAANARNARLAGLSTKARRQRSRRRANAADDDHFRRHRNTHSAPAGAAANILAQVLEFAIHHRHNQICGNIGMLQLPLVDQPPGLTLVAVTKIHDELITLLLHRGNDARLPV